MHRIRVVHLPILALLLGASANAQGAPTTEWHVDFGSTGRLPIGPDEKPQLQRNPANDAVHLHNLSQWPMPPLAAKVDMWGNAAWSVLERSTTYTYPQRLEELSDGSMITSHDNVTRYAVDGTFLWSAPDGPGRQGVSTVIEVGSEILVFSSASNTVSRLDRATGVPIEKLSSSALGNCRDGMAATSGVDTVYWGLGCEGTLVKLRLAPLRIEWSVEIPAADGMSRPTIVADEGGVHAAFTAGSASRVARISAANGSVLWSAGGAYGDQPRVILDSDGDPLVYGSSVIEKLARDTGMRRWLHTAAGTVVDIDVSTNAIVVAGNAGAAGTAAFAQRLRSSDGASQWQTALDAPGSEWMNLTSVVVPGDRVLAAGVACAANARPERCDLMLWPFGIDGSGPGSMIPTFDLPATGRAVAASSDTTVGAALAYGPLGMQLRVQRVRNADGQVLWDVTRPVVLPNAPGLLPNSIELAVADGGVAVLYTRSFRIPGVPHSSEAMVVAFDATTGAFRWERSAFDLSGGFTDGNAQHVGIDPAGNVFASSHEANTPEDLLPITQSRRQIRKYAAVTGQEIQQLDFAVDTTSTMFTLYSPTFRIVGGDILADEKPLPSTDYALTRIDGATGAVLWSNPALFYPYPYTMSVLHAGRAYVATSDAEVSVEAYDVVTGLASWLTGYSHPSDIGYGVWSSYRGSDGAIYVGGYRRIPRPGGSPNSWDSRGLLMRLDSNSGAIDWVDRFDTAPVASPSGQLLPVLDHDGVLYSWQRQARGVESPGYFYTGTSTTDGALRGTQAVYLGTTPFPHLGHDASNIEVLGAASDGGSVVHGGFGDASQPHSFGIAKWPAPQAFAGGALRVSLSTSVQSLTAEIATSFVLDATNEGVVTAPAVDVLLAIPLQSSVGPIDCRIDGVACTAKVTPTSIGHRVGMPPGARVRISGSVRHPTGTTVRVEASAF